MSESAQSETSACHGAAHAQADAPSNEGLAIIQELIAVANLKRDAARAQYDVAHAITPIEESRALDRLDALNGEIVQREQAVWPRARAFASGAPRELTAATPDDIRAAGWTVAVHNDYRLQGVAHTFWLFTKGDRAVKGEGRSDSEALDAIRAQIFSTSAGNGSSAIG